MHLLTGEVQQINSMNRPREAHTVYNDAAELKAYLIGGYNGDYMKECLIFDILNQKFTLLGWLNRPR